MSVEEVGVMWVKVDGGEEEKEMKGGENGRKENKKCQ
jgi:hypothetical protein